MGNRVLTQAAVSFLLGILASRYGEPWCYALWAVWAAFAGVCVWRRGVSGSEKGSSPGSTWRRNGSESVGRSSPGSATVQAVFRTAVCLGFCLLGYCSMGRQQGMISAVEEALTAQEETAAQGMGQAAGFVITVRGTVYKKEEKSWSIVYYLKNSYILREKGWLSAGKILIYQETDDYSIGDTVELTGTAEKFEEARNEGNFDEKEYYYSKGILFAVKADTTTLLHRQRFRWQEGLYALRKRIQQVYAGQLPEKTAGVLGVMALGEKGMLDGEVKKLYQQSGISHVLAISGLHVSLVGMGLYRFLRKKGLSYWFSGALAGLLVFLFGEISGMELSTRRAVVMFLVMLLGNVLGMAYDSVTGLSFSALLQLWENPGCLWNTGFLLSYSAVLAVVAALGIFKEGMAAGLPEKSGQGKRGKRGKSGEEEMGGKRGKSGKKEMGGKRGESGKKEKREGETGEKGILVFLENGWKKGKKTLWETLPVSLVIQLVTLPLTVFFFYEVPVYSVLINGLLLPFMGVVLLSGLTGGLVGTVSEGLIPGVLAGAVSEGGNPAGLAFVLKSGVKGLSWMLLQPARLLLSWNEWVCRCFSRLPGAMWITGKPSVEGVVAYYVILAAVLVGFHRLRASVSQARSRLGFKLLLLSVVCVSLAILLAVRTNRGFQICFLDVGQGDGIYIEDGRGTAFFIDGGSTNESRVGEYRLLSFLKCRGASSVEGWFVSHADEDHISGLLEVWESGYRVRRLFLSKWIVQDEAWEELCAMAKQYGTEIVYLKPQDVVVAGELEFVCLYPERAGTDRNDTSLVLKLAYRDFTAVFAGDISAAKEKELLRQYPGLTVDLYKAIHHGSDNSNSAALLQALAPTVCVVSCAAENSYGHPGKNAVARMLDAGGRLFYTMEGGQITVGYDGKGIWVREKVEK